MIAASIRSAAIDAWTGPLRRAVPSRSACAAWFDASGLATLTRRISQASRIVALAYHRIGSPANSPFDHGLWSATPDQFDEHLRFLERSFDLITARELDAALASRTGRFALVTFDDGYRDNYTTALPILRAHGVRATFFISTGFIDAPQLPWWDEIAWMVRSMAPRVIRSRFLNGSIEVDTRSDVDAAIRRLLRIYKTLAPQVAPDYLDWLGRATGRGRYSGPADDLWLTWDMVRELHAAGMEIGGHTVTHPVLARLDPANQAHELALCKHRIETEVGAPMASFSYPVGGRDAFDRVSQACLTAAGVRYAFNYYGGGALGPTSDPYNLPRTAVERSLSMRRLRAAVSLPVLFG